MALSSAQITHCAVGILRDYGLADLSMRRLAAELGVQPGALYWHVSNKQELLILTAKALLARAVETRPAPENILDLSHNIRRALLRVRDGADVVLVALAASKTPLPALELLPHLLTHQEPGLSRSHANWGAKTLEHHILAAVAEESNSLNLGNPSDPTSASAFEYGIRIILDGITYQARKDQSG